MMPMIMTNGFLSKRKKAVQLPPNARLSQVQSFNSAGRPSQKGANAEGRLQPNVSLCSKQIRSIEAPPKFEGKKFSEARYQLCKPKISWKYPPPFTLNGDWQMVAGEESIEKVVQKIRERGKVEAIYPHASAIPSSPSVLPELEDHYYDDRKTPVIPLEFCEVEDSTSIDSTPHSSLAVINQRVEVASTAPCTMLVKSNATTTEKPHGSSSASEADVLAAATAAFIAILKSNERGTLIDINLLIKILNDPNIIELLSEASCSPASDRATSIDVPKQVTASVISPCKAPPLSVSQKQLKSSRIMQQVLPQASCSPVSENATSIRVSKQESVDVSSPSEVQLMSVSQDGPRRVAPVAQVPASVTIKEEKSDMLSRFQDDPRRVAAVSQVPASSVTKKEENSDMLSRCQQKLKPAPAKLLTSQPNSKPIFSRLRARSTSSVSESPRQARPLSCKPRPPSPTARPRIPKARPPSLRARAQSLKARPLYFTTLEKVNDMSPVSLPVTTAFPSLGSNMASPSTNPTSFIASSGPPPNSSSTASSKLDTVNVSSPASLPVTPTSPASLPVSTSSAAPLAVSTPSLAPQTVTTALTSSASNIETTSTHPNCLNEGNRSLQVPQPFNTSSTVAVTPELSYSDKAIMVSSEIVQADQSLNSPRTSQKMQEDQSLSTFQHLPPPQDRLPMPAPSSESASAVHYRKSLLMRYLSESTEVTEEPAPQQSSQVPDRRRGHSPMSWSGHEKPTSQRSGICLFFDTKKGCRNGSRCRFDHVVVPKTRFKRYRYAESDCYSTSTSNSNGNSNRSKRFKIFSSFNFLF